VKLALLGDIHGNHLALEAVLAAARKQGAERALITGDIVGYYFWPRKVLELLAPWDAFIVRGNHEDMLHAAQSDPAILAGIDSLYGTGLRCAIEQLGPQQLDQLYALPHPLELAIDGCRILLCHGAPWDIDQYVYPDANPDLLKRCAIPEFDLVVLGHTHYPLHDEIGSTLVINPGSVGQPRNRRPGAHWTLFDTRSREVTPYCEAYDASFVIAESRRRHPEIPYLATVLERT
jgi:putative phosphoesterase